MTGKCVEKCDKHVELGLKVATIDGKLLILILMITTLIAGTGFNVLQSHRVDKQMLAISLTVAANTAQQKLTASVFDASRSHYQDRVTLLDRNVESISTYCCSELGTFGWQIDHKTNNGRGE